MIIKLLLKIKKVIKLRCLKKFNFHCISLNNFNLFYFYFTFNYYDDNFNNEFE